MRICAYTASSGSGTGGFGFGGVARGIACRVCATSEAMSARIVVHRGRQEAGRGIFVFERRVFDHQQADALQRRMQVAQCQHDGRARALAAQEARLARGAEHERVERIVQRLAEFDAEIGGGAMQDFAARVIERDRAITRVRQRLLEGGNPARRNFNDLLVEHRRTDGRLARI